MSGDVYADGVRELMDVSGDILLIREGVLEVLDEYLGAVENEASKDFINQIKASILTHEVIHLRHLADALTAISSGGKGGGDRAA